MPNVFFPAEMTPTKPADFAAAAGAAWQKVVGNKLSDNGVYLLTAHWGLETGWGDFMYCYNCGNVKAFEGKWSGGICYYECGENFDKAVWADFYPRSYGKQGVINRFRAFPTLIDGVTDYVTISKGYASVLNSGDPATYSHQLKQNRYYTASEESYTKTLVSAFGLAKKFVGKVPAPAPLEVRRIEPAGLDPLQDPDKKVVALDIKEKKYWPYPPRGPKISETHHPCCNFCKGVFAMHNGFKKGGQEEPPLLEGYKDPEQKDEKKDDKKDDPPAQAGGENKDGAPPDKGEQGGKEAKGEGGQPADDKDANTKGVDPQDAKGADNKGADGKGAAGGGEDGKGADNKGADNKGAGGNDQKDAASKLIVEGDFAKVKVQLAAGDTDAHPKRPGPGTQVIWGGDGTSTPWGHLISLIEKSGGSISYTQVHAADFIEHAAELPRPSGAPGAAPSAPANAEPAPAPAQEKDDAKKDDKPQVTVKPPSTPADTATEDHHVGAAGSGPLFEYGVTFAYQGEEARIWAHPRAANAGPRPLLVLLHGINAGGEKHSSLSNDAGKKSGNWVHVGKLAQKLIDDGLVSPMVIAAPTNASGTPWGKFDLPSFVNMVEQQVRGLNVELDLDQVSLAAHSGGGGYPGRGLNKIAAEGAMFSGHKLRVFGIEDTRIIAPMAKEYAEGIKKANNDVTTIYSVHRSTGGWSTPEYNANGGSPKFAEALGATHKVTDHVVATESLEDTVDYYDNGDEKPARISIKIKEQVLPKYHQLWTAAGGYNGNLGSHSDMVPMWCWWSLPRFYPQTDADKKLMAAHKAAQEPPKPVQPTLPKAPAGPPAVTGGDPNIPPPPEVWTNPAGDIKPKAFAPAQFADPSSAVFWPVRAEKHPWKRGVHYMGEDNQVYNYLGKHGSGCHWMAGRPNGRTHVGVDLNFGSYGSVVVACEAGKIIKFYPFLGPVYALIVQHDSGVVINYGEVAASSLSEFHLKVGDRVTAGQPIAKIGRCPEGDSMLHFETYPQGTAQNVSYPSGAGKDHLAKYYNPTAYLLYLAKNGR